MVRGGDGTASRAAGVRLKKCVVRAFVVSEPDIRTTGHIFLFGPEKPLGEPRILSEEKMTVPLHSAGGDVLRRANFAWGFYTHVSVVAGTPYDFCVGIGVVLIA